MNNFHLSSPLTVFNMAGRCVDKSEYEYAVAKANERDPIMRSLEDSARSVFTSVAPLVDSAAKVVRTGVESLIAPLRPMLESTAKHMEINTRTHDHDSHQKRTGLALREGDEEEDENGSRGVKSVKDKVLAHVIDYPRFCENTVEHFRRIKNLNVMSLTSSFFQHRL